MSYYQYRYIRDHAVMSDMEKVIPQLIPFMNRTSIWSYNQMLGHELAHSMELVHRGQHERLKLDNHGWVIGKFGHTPKTATAECRVFALQYLFEEACLGHQSDDALCLQMSSQALSSKHKMFWPDLEHRKAWLAESSVEHRILGFMEEHRPTFRGLLDETIDYIVDECANYI